MKAMPTRRLRRVSVVLALFPLAVACGGDGHGSADLKAAGTPALTAARTRLVITTDNGLRLRATDGRRVTVDGHVRRHWTHHDGTWTLDLSCSDEGDGPCPRMPEVDVPDDVGVTVTARNAGLDAAGVAAPLDLTTVNGDVTVTRSGREDAVVRLSTRNGSVRANALAAGRLAAGTTNGDVSLACADVPSTVTAATTNGSVDVTVPHGGPAYRVSATTANGRTTVTLPTEGADRGRTMTLTTVNGDVDARGD
ncbi:DUF4097 family beta strand repeat-containing protein [Streptomyces sp. 7R007]